MRSRSRAVLVVILTIAAVSCSRDPEKLKRRHVDNGDKYVAQKKYAEAIVEYRNAVAVDPRFGEARFKLAGAYAETGDINSALREYVRAADLMPDNVDAQLRAGNGLLAAGLHQDAKQRALAALRKDPNNVTGLVLMGNALAGMKDLDGAISVVEQAIDTDPRQTLTYTNLGALELAKGDRSAALAAFKRAIAVDPHSASGHLALANYYWATNDRTEAEAELKVALQNEPKSLAANRALAVFYGLTNRPSESEQYLKAYADLAPDSGPKVTLADFYLLRNKTQEATAVLQPLVNTKDGFVPAKIRLAAIDFAAGRRTQAYQALDDVIKRDPRNEAALLEKSRLQMLDRKPAEALATANAVLIVNPKSAAGHFLKGQILTSTGSTDDAVKEYQEVLQLSPAATAALIQLAQINLARGDSSAAADLASQAIKAQPQSGIAHYLLAKSLLRQGKLTTAEQEVKGLEKGSAASPDVQTLVGDFYFAKHDFTRARASYNAALKLKDGSSDAIAGLVAIDLAQKNTDAARSTIEAQLAKTPDNERLLVIGGDTFLMIGDSKRAESTLRHLLQVNPSNIAAYSRLGFLYGSQHRLDEARKEYEEIARRNPKAAAAATTMVGTILTLQNKRDEAREQYKRALDLDPQMPVAANNLAWDYAQNGGNLDVALQLAQTAKAKLPNEAQVSDTLGWIYYKKDLAGLAITSLEEATKQAPSDPSIRYRLGLAYLKSGDQQKARGALVQALKLNPQFREADDARKALAEIKG
jgi:tetratricopeptide (TPR) repeat protein